MNKKGFTLIELLAVIVILAVIALIATPVIMNAISTAKEKAYYRQVEMVEDAAEIYIANKINNEVAVEEYIFLDSLVNAGRLKGIPTDSIHGGNLKGVIKTTNNGVSYDYEYLEVNSTNGEVVYIDPTKTVKSIVIEGNSEQKITMQGKNLLGPANKVNGRSYGFNEVNTKYYTDSTMTSYITTCKPNTTYSFSRSDDPNEYYNFRVFFYDIDPRDVSAPNSIGGGYFDNSLSFNITTPSTCKFMLLSTGPTANQPKYIQMELGSVATNYEEFVPNSPSPDYPSEIKFVSGNIVINGNSYSIPELKSIGNIKETFSFIDGVKVNKVGLFTANGTESWNKETYNFWLPFSNSSDDFEVISNRFETLKSPGNDNMGTLRGGGYNIITNKYNKNILFNHMADINETISTFKSWVTNIYSSGNPLKVYYKLGTYTNTNLAPTTLPSNSGYVYLDSEVKGNIIVEYY